MIHQLRSDLAQARLDLETADDRARTALIIEGCLTCVGGDEYKAMLANLTATQRRCTELKLELRAYRASGICLTGWWCPCEATDKSLGIFNGGSKEPLTHCRCCGNPRPT